ncbi:MAG: LuxR C-terminal-related transcriptional regulator [Fimbriimonadaceae bacterium]|nr:LuxR C-terminal-related transcriptional regulator [Fimbriimonadaceae bacterium]
MFERRRYFLDEMEAAAPGVGRWKWDLLTDRFVGSPAFYKNRGVPAEDLVQPDLTSQLNRAVTVGRDRVVEATTDFLLGLNVPPPIYRAAHPDGSEHVLLVSARKVRDSDGRIVQLRGTLTDITEHPNVISVAICSNDALTSAGLRQSFARVEWGRVLTELPCSGMERMPEGTNLVLIAIEPGDMGALAAMRGQSQVRTIVVLDQRHRQLLPELLEMKPEGLLAPEKLSETLPVALLAARSGERYISPAFIEAVASRNQDLMNADAAGDRLTDVELKVLRMLAVGMRNEEIAREIYVSLPTVKRCTQRIYLKLGARDRAQAVDIAHRQRLV